ncbi:mycofactocin biosynthesis peptidyl-dipeptidase MftE [Calidifontibacter terrae]
MTATRPALRLEAISSTRVDDLDRPWLLVPVGSTEQHGPHLPCGTDSLVARTVASRVGARLTAAGECVVVAPGIDYGSSGEHEDFAGTISIGTDALRGLLVELVRSASRWAGATVLVNGHGGNVEAVRSAVRLLRSEGRSVAWVPAGPSGGDAHAGRTETAMMLALRPDQVAMDRAQAGRTEPLPELLERLRREGVRAVSPTGVLGDPRHACATDGAQLLDGVVDEIVRRLRTVNVDGDGMLASAGPVA